jgi:hypothetical protein
MASTRYPIEGLSAPVALVPTRVLVGIRVKRGASRPCESCPGRGEPTSGQDRADAAGRLAHLVHWGRWNGTVVMMIPSYAISDARRRAAIRL